MMTWRSGATVTGLTPTGRGASSVSVPRRRRHTSRDKHLVENNVAGQKDWWPANMERPVHRLYDETAHADHHYWLWQDGEFSDVEALPTPEYDRTDAERDADERKMLGKPRSSWACRYPKTHSMKRTMSWTTGATSSGKTTDASL